MKAKIKIQYFNIDNNKIVKNLADYENMLNVLDDYSHFEVLECNFQNELIADINVFFSCFNHRDILAMIEKENFEPMMLNKLYLTSNYGTEHSFYEVKNQYKMDMFDLKEYLIKKIFCYYHKINYDNVGYYLNSNMLSYEFNVDCNIYVINNKMYMVKNHKELSSVVWFDKWDKTEKGLSQLLNKIN